MTTTPWDLVRYGWDVVWWATVEGVPVIWTEQELGLTLPTGFASEVAALRIDDVAPLGVEAQPDEGVAAGLPFTLELLDLGEARDWMAWPSVQRRLSAAITASAASIGVDSTAGLSSPVWIGNERVTYTGTAGGDTLTGCTRGTGGSLAYAHRADGAGGIVGTAPRPDWRGRRVRLYVAAIDPAGVAYGASLAAISVEVWAGYVDEGPYRGESSTWRLDCLPLVRRLAEDLPPSQAGVVDGQTRWHTVQAGDGVSVAITLSNGGIVSESFSFVVYDAAALGATIATKAASTIRGDTIAAWDAAVSALGGGTFSSALKFVWDKKAKLFRAEMMIGTMPAADFQLAIEIVAGGKKYKQSGFVIVAVANLLPLPLGWSFASSPLHPYDDGQSDELVVQLPASQPADVVAPGALVYDGALHTYATRASLEGAVRLGGLQPPIDPSKAHGADIEIVQYAEGALADVLRQIVESSGTASLRGSYDTLAADAGYAIDDGQVDEAAFGSVGGVLAGVQVAGVVSGRSLATAFGGLLGLAERCIVQRDDGAGVQRLALVAVAPVGSGTVATITDADLLSAAGDDPIAVERGARTPTIIEAALDPGVGEPTSIVALRDGSRRQSVGAVTLAVTLPLVDASEALSLVTVWAGARFGRPQMAERLRLRVGPWMRGEVGDVVRVELTHPALYDRRLGVEGYSGPARVVGRTVQPATGVVELLLAPCVGAGLAPAAQVQGYTGPAATPTTIDVPLSYLPHFERALESKGGNIKVLHFKPAAAETVTQGYTLSAATSTGGYCRLTVASIIGAPTLSVSGDRSYLTIPVSGDAAIAEYQSAFAHEDDSEYWA